MNPRTRFFRPLLVPITLTATSHLHGQAAPTEETEVRDLSETPIRKVSASIHFNTPVWNAQKRKASGSAVAVHFGGPAAPLDKVGKAAEPGLIRMDPEVQGEWKWAANQQPPFSPPAGPTQWLLGPPAESKLLAIGACHFPSGLGENAALAKAGTSPMKNMTRTMLSGTALLLALASPLHSQDAELSPEDAAAYKAHNDFMESLSWQTQGTGSLGSRADIAIPEGYRFLGSGDSSKLMKYYGNLSNGSELGFIAPNDLEWFALFEFDDVGYVKDDEKDKLDADTILKQLREGQQAANEELARLGHSTLNVLGWHTPPFYNTETKNLEWAIRLSSSDGGEILNYKTKLLGRRGVMDVVLVCSEEQLASVIPQYQGLLSGYAYKQEENYAAFTQGDKIAEYGLIGLIAGGGLLVAAKSGLLAKLWKPILAGIVIVGAFLKRIFRGRTPESI